jgi:hypothetical protein
MPKGKATSCTRKTSIGESGGASRRSEARDKRIYGNVSFWYLDPGSIVIFLNSVFIYNQECIEGAKNCNYLLK